MFKPNFTITLEINSRIAEIEKFKTIIDQASILPELVVQLRFRATVESVHSSTSIEGNPLSEQQVQNVLRGKTITASDYAIKEVLNYKNTIDWLHQKNKSDHILISSEIIEFHKILMDGLLQNKKVGQWRPGPIYIVDEINKREVVRYTGPDARVVPRLIDSFIKWVLIQIEDEKLHPVLLAGLIHFIFVSIHPFSDGNGRASRLLTHHYLRYSGYDFKDSLSLDNYYLQNQGEYYEALSRGETFNERMYADITPFLDYFTQGFLTSAQIVSQYIKSGRVTDNNKKPIRLNKEELQILDYIYQFGSTDISEMVEVLGSTKRTAQRRIMSLVEKEILTVEGKGPATKYMLYPPHSGLNTHSDP